MHGLIIGVCMWPEHPLGPIRLPQTDLTFIGFGYYLSGSSTRLNNKFLNRCQPIRAYKRLLIPQTLVLGLPCREDEKRTRNEIENGEQKVLGLLCREEENAKKENSLHILHVENSFVNFCHHLFLRKLYCNNHHKLNSLAVVHH